MGSILPSRSGVSLGCVRKGLNLLRTKKGVIVVDPDELPKTPKIAWMISDVSLWIGIPDTDYSNTNDPVLWPHL